MPLKPGSPEWRAKVDAMLAQEANEPEQWWYLSFVGDVGGVEKFLGACVVHARGMTGAIRRAHALGINPGGQVMAIAAGEDKGPMPSNRLLSKAELGPAETVGELEDRGVLPGTRVGFLD